MVIFRFKRLLLLLFSAQADRQAGGQYHSNTINVKSLYTKRSLYNRFSNYKSMNVNKMDNRRL